ncbi:MAG: HD-GYP domain-containing protein [Phycisphaerales bacterium]
MIRLRLDKIRPGMVTASTIWNPVRPDQILIERDVVLDANILRRLEQLGIERLYIQAPGLDLVRQYIDPELERARDRLHLVGGELIDAIRREDRRNQNWRKFEIVIEELVRHMSANPAGAVFTDPAASRDNLLLDHAVDVCYLCTLLGLRSQGYLVRQRRRLSPTQASNLTNLAIAGLLHDLGMYELPASTQERWLLDRDETDATWRQHVDLGYQRVNGVVDTVVCAAIRQHHQYYDGSGFPRKKLWDGREVGVAGDQIHVFARVVTAADIFSEVKSCIERRGMLNVRALAQVVSGAVARRIDPVVLKALLEVVPAYPPGTPVRLTDGRHGVVIDWKPNRPCRPAVAMTGPVEEYVIEEPHAVDIVDLVEAPQLAIAEVEGADVTRDNFEPPAGAAPRGTARAFDVLDVA